MDDITEQHVIGKSVADVRASDYTLVITLNDGTIIEVVGAAIHTPSGFDANGIETNVYPNKES